ncbi:MAG: hypothetical protein ACYC6A_00830 [Armatimonadota bacterium]
MAAYRVTPIGEVLAARWSGGNVLVSFNGAAEVTAFALAVESALAIDEEPDGAVIIVYQTDAGLALKRTLDRATWS